MAVLEQLNKFDQHLQLLQFKIKINPASTITCLINKIIVISKTLFIINVVLFGFPFTRYFFND